MICHVEVGVHMNALADGGRVWITESVKSQAFGPSAADVSIQALMLVSDLAGQLLLLQVEYVRSLD